MVNVIKKSGAIEGWNDSKLKQAVQKAADRIGKEVDDIQFKKLLQNVKEKIQTEICVKDLHNLVEKCLFDIPDLQDVGQAYSSYRNYKQEFSELIQDLHNKAKAAIQYGDKENANFESSLVSTQQSLIRGYLTKELYKLNYLTKSEKEAIEDGFIYIHDLRDLIFNTFNCCLFDMASVLEGGFEMANLHYKEPNSVLSALQLIGDVTLAASAQQYGGFTIPEIDKILIKYAKKTVENLKDLAAEYSIKDIDGFVDKGLTKELMQGFQSLEMKLNSVPSSRGDFAFTTLTFGNLEGEDMQLQAKICHAILDNRMKGQPVVFPKLVMLFSWKQYEENCLQQELFSKCIGCSCKVLYPDYLAIDTVGKVAEYYKTSGKVVSPMGCRAYLSEYFDEKGEMFFTGRANIGAVSLNLPMIYMKAKEEGKNFYDVLDVYLQMIRKFLLRRYDCVANSRASTNPLAFTQNGMKGGNLKPWEKVGKLVDGFTASFGITALNELNQLHEQKSLVESDGVFVNSVVDYISEVVARFKDEDGRLYALYGTPAESLAGVQLQQFKTKYGVIPNVSDRAYFTNSFHAHVSEEISPFTKQDVEFKLFHKINGGHIQYTRVDTNKPNVVKGIVLRGMSMGFYSGVNAEKNFCDSCGHKWSDSRLSDCPECGSHDIYTIDRVCGYLGFSKQKGDTRFNDAKLAEVKDRISM